VPDIPLTPQRVILEAGALADEVGLTNVTLSAVARRLGVKTPSLYAHVRDLAAVRDGVAILALTELAESVASNIAGRAGRDALTGFAEAHRALAVNHPGHWQALQTRARSSVVDSPAARSLVSLSGAVLNGYGIDGEDRAHAIRFIGSTLNGFLTLSAIGSFDHSAIDAGPSWPVMIAALDTAIRHWPRGAAAASPDFQEVTPLTRVMTSRGVIFQSSSGDRCATRRTARPRSLSARSA